MRQWLDRTSRPKLYERRCQLYESTHQQRRCGHQSPPRQGDPCVARALVRASANGHQAVPSTKTRPRERLLRGSLQGRRLEFGRGLRQIRRGDGGSDCMSNGQWRTRQARRALSSPGCLTARRSHLRPLLPFACRWVRRIYIHANTLTTTTTTTLVGELSPDAGAPFSKEASTP